MGKTYNNEINLLGSDEQQRRMTALRGGMKEAGIRHALVSTPANIYYLTGRVFFGFILADSATEEVHYLVRRPNDLTGCNVHHINKPAEIPAVLHAVGVTIEDNVGLELGTVPYDTVARLLKALDPTLTACNITPILRQARSVKTPMEQDKLRLSGNKHTLVYERIPRLYRSGMSDVELQIEIERELRMGGCLGQFRVAGIDMEIFMGNVLTGDNADTPTPYDFAMGGAGQNPSLPLGADGTVIMPGHPVMVDVNGNFTGHMTDMTRTFGCGSMPESVIAANRLSADICDTLAQMMTPGTPAKDLYDKAAAMAAEAGMADFFMGHHSHAGFVGHGVGIDINELPVIAPRSRDILQQGNVIALEPKFVLPGLGAVGIENTYIVRDKAPAEKLTTAPEEIIPFCC